MHKFKRTPLRALCLLSLAGLGSFSALNASAQVEGHFYGGIGMGQAQSKIDVDRINANLLSATPSLTTTSMTRSESDASYKVFGGYQFSPYWGVEAGYFSLGQFGFNSTTTPTGSLDGRIKLDGVNVDLVGTMPINDQLSLLGRVGAHNARARDTFTGTGNVVVTDPNPQKTQTNSTAGFGFAYQFSPSMTLRGELERYRINDAVGNRGDINVASLSLVFPFGRTPEPAPKVVERVVYQQAPTPEPIIIVAPPAPLPAPVPVPVPAPTPERLRVSFNADVLFGFDNANMRLGGKEALNKFTQELKGVEYDHITVEGHTDRIGQAAYNEKLSLQRADAVKNYLVNTSGLSATKITTVGKGSSAPATAEGECKGIKTSAAVIACLQPDRRVDIDVTGSRPAGR
jgi:OOP family OmpA-OmpF porin